MATSDTTRPVAPDEDFASRFAQTYSYGFYMRNTPSEDVQSVINHPERWVILNINPQNLTWREPVATAITPTQGGGKVIESRGGVLKYGQMSGTTGYLPASPHETGAVPTISPSGPRAPLVDDKDPDLDLKLGVKSGFYKFHKLRHLFRLFMWERRRGNTGVTLHYMDFKSNEFWRIEPSDFTMRRSSKKPFLYDYDINFTAIEPSDAIEPTTGIYVQSWLLPTFDPSKFDAVASAPFSLSAARRGADVLGVYNEDGTLVTVNRMKTLRQAGLGYIQHLSGSIQRRFQNALLYVSQVTQFFDDIHSALHTILDLPIVLLKQTRGALEALSNVVDQFAPENIKEEMNGWWLEMMGLVNDITVSADSIASRSRDALKLNDDFKNTKAKQGFQTDLLQEPDGSLGSPNANPFIGSSGLGLITDITALSNTQQLQAIPVFDGDTIWSLAQRVYGDVSRFVDLVILNALSAPYIVNDASNKPSGTLAWGESILVPTTVQESLVDAMETGTPVPTYTGVCTSTGVPNELIDETARDVTWRTDQWIGYTVTLRPDTATEERRVVSGNSDDVLTMNYSWAVSPAVDDVYTMTLEIFEAGRPVTPEAKAYGRDILLVFNRKDGSATYGRPRATCVLNQRGDLATVVGIDNIIQSIHLRTETELKRHPFHPSFGISFPIGRPWSAANALFYSYFARRSFLQDPRIASVRKSKLSFQGGTMSYSAEVQPAQSRKARPVNVAVR